MRKLWVTVLVSMAIAACSPEATVTTTTSTTAPPTSTTTTATSVPETTTTEAGAVVETYDVVISSTNEQGKLLWIVIPPGEYSAVAVESLLTRVIEEVEGPIVEIHVFDDPEALEASRIPEADRTDEQQSLVADHYLISFIGGNTVRFQGPFEDLGEYAFGS